MNRITILISFILLFLLSCKSGNNRSQEDKTSIKQFEITEAWRTDTLFMTPESVIYDRKRDVLYVSNVNLEPRKKDGNGFISILSKEGKILNLKWIEGLSSPKGMAIIGDTLFAADVDEVVVMDINRGQIIRKLPVNDVGMLNDITSDEGDNLYISDTDKNKIYIYRKGSISDWLTVGLNAPNGLLSERGRLLIASQGSSDLTTVDITGNARTMLADSVGRGDGIAFTGIRGYYILTDWSGEIFMINPDKTKVSLLNTKEQQSNTADIEYLSDLNLLLVPTFFKNCVTAYKLAEKE